MTVGTHKLSGKLLIFVACQYFKGDSLQKKGSDVNEEMNYICVLEVDHNTWKVTPIKIVRPKVA